MVKGLVTAIGGNEGDPFSSAVNKLMGLVDTRCGVRSTLPCLPNATAVTTRDRTAGNRGGDKSRDTGMVLG